MDADSVQSRGGHRQRLKMFAVGFDQLDAGRAQAALAVRQRDRARSRREIELKDQIAAGQIVGAQRPVQIGDVEERAFERRAVFARIDVPQAVAQAAHEAHKAKAFGRIEVVAGAAHARTRFTPFQGAITAEYCDRGLDQLCFQDVKSHFMRFDRAHRSDPFNCLVYNIY